MKKIAIFTTGLIGWGHKARAAAIRRAFTRAHVQIDGFTVNPFEATTSAIGYTRAQWQARQLAEFAPDLVLVDIDWPAWLASAHSSVQAPVWTLHRWMPDNWTAQAYSGAQPETIVTIEGDRILLPEDAAPVVSIDPIVGWNSGELYTREQARRVLGLPLDQRIAGVVHAGELDEVGALMKAVQADEADRCVVLRDYPNAQRLLHAFDRYATGAGYNCSWEAFASGTTAAQVRVPFDRGNGEQEWRDSYLRQLHYSEPYGNGADQLVGMICERLSL